MERKWEAKVVIYVILLPNNKAFNLLVTMEESQTINGVLYWLWESLSGSHAVPQAIWEWTRLLNGLDKDSVVSKVWKIGGKPVHLAQAKQESRESTNALV